MSSGRGDRHGDRPCPVGVGVAPSDRGEDRARQLQHQRRVGGGQRAEGLDAEAGERAVAQRGRPWPSRGARSIIPTSPTTSPRAISPITAPSRLAASLPLTTRYPASDASPSSKRTSTGSQVHPLPRLDDLGGEGGVDGEQLGHQVDGPVTVRCAPGDVDHRPASPARRTPANVGARRPRAGGRADAPAPARSPSAGTRRGRRSRRSCPRTDGVDASPARVRGGSRTGPRRP